MSVALLWVVSPNSQLSNSFGFNDSVRLSDSSGIMYKDRSSMSNCRPKKALKQTWRSCSLHTDLGTSCLGGMNMVVSPAGEMALSSEEKVYNVVLKQAALVKKQLRSNEDLDVKPDIALPGNLGLLGEAYDRCREVCAEYAKTFYLG